MTVSQQFPRSRRLLKREEFERVRKEGSFVRGSFLSLSWLGTVEDGLRAGFVTSRRVGSAVVRNRVRRRLREIFRRHQNELRPSFHVVTIAGPVAARATFAELEHEWLRLAKRTSILAP